MLDLNLAPLNETITLEALIDNPYPIYQKLRAETPVVRVAAVNRTMLTKAVDTRYVKNNPELFSSDDPNTPMKRAFQAHTLMRKDGEEHAAERGAMSPALTPRAIKNIWIPAYTKIADDYLDQLPKGETVEFFSSLAGNYPARCLTQLLGIPDATDAEMQYWSQTLINGAGNFGWEPELFEICDRAHIEMNACIARNSERLRAEPDDSILSVMVNAEAPIPESQIVANIKIAIGGGINEPRDAFCTVLYGLLTNPDQLEAVRRGDITWSIAFEEAVRWVAPIQVSSRLVTADTKIRGFHIPKGDTVMTIQASANRDEDEYDDPEVFNVFRGRTNHQAFGNGPHFCLGTHIARKMLPEIILPRLFERFPALSLPEPEAVVWKGFGFRGPINLPILLK
jgi:cytochrome P450